jgi:transcriptional regulator with XRE-family HTH domain
MTTVLAQRLRAARTSLHPAVTQREVAKRFQLSPSAITLWEKGRTQPSAEHLAELSRWYQVSTDWLLGVETTAPVPRSNRGKPPLHTVPVVPPSALLKWRWDAVAELLQTSVSYPPNTAAAMLVSSDALTSACPTGCYAVISKGNGARPGQVVLASVSRAGDPVLRKYINEGVDELLVADDTRYPTFRLRDGVRILGRLCEITIRRRF